MVIFTAAVARTLSRRETTDLTTTPGARAPPLPRRPRSVQQWLWVARSVSQQQPTPPPPPTQDSRHLHGQRVEFGVGWGALDFCPLSTSRCTHPAADPPEEPRPLISWKQTVSLWRFEDTWTTFYSRSSTLTEKSCCVLRSQRFLRVAPRTRPIIQNSKDSQTFI